MCYLCSKVVESHYHLIFQCEMSSAILGAVRKKLCMQVHSLAMMDLLQLFHSARSLEVGMGCYVWELLLSLCSVIYAILSLNKVLFSNQLVDVELYCFQICNRLRFWWSSVGARRCRKTEVIGVNLDMAIQGDDLWRFCIDEDFLCNT